MNSLAVLSLALLATLYVTCLVDVTVAYDDKNSDDDGAVEIPPNYWSQQLAELTELVKLGEQALAEKLAKEMDKQKRRGCSKAAVCGPSKAARQKIQNIPYRGVSMYGGAGNPGRKRRTVADDQA
ncbi:uncharacterized protein LOC144448357 isoform X3 [Glandiceps talaboti]